MHQFRALLFDVFGTLIGWRLSIAREAQKILAPHGICIDQEAFADARRGQHQPAMEEVRCGCRPFSKLGAARARDFKPKPEVYLFRRERHAITEVNISATGLADLANQLGCA